MKLTDHHSAQATKMLYIGNSGVGKTGSLVSLARAGYNLRVLDFDNGLDVLRKILTSPMDLHGKVKSPADVQRDKDALARIDFETCTDKFRIVGGKPLPDGVPQAWGKALKLLDKWGDYGAVSTWGPKDILIIDSMTIMGEATLRYILALNGRIAAHPQIQDWGAAMQLIQDLLAMLYSDAIKCNVLITSHIVFVENENGISRGYPSALGSKLPPKVGRYFNTVVMAKTVGSGASAKKVIRTASEGLIDLKHSAPGLLPEELPLDTGLATIFNTLQGD